MHLVQHKLDHSSPKLFFLFASFHPIKTLHKNIFISCTRNFFQIFYNYIFSLWLLLTLEAFFTMSKWRRIEWPQVTTQSPAFRSKKTTVDHTNYLSNFKMASKWKILPNSTTCSQVFLKFKQLNMVLIKLSSGRKTLNRWTMANRLWPIVYGVIWFVSLFLVSEEQPRFIQEKATFHKKGHFRFKT